MRRSRRSRNRRSGSAAIGGDYTPLDELPNVPYVCLRLPTGGGKTILGAHAIGIARDAWMEKDYPMVLWLVPSNTIRLQTVEALKNTRHPYRQALDEAFDGRVRVFDIADFTHDPPARHPRPLLHRRRHDPDAAGDQHRRPQGLFPQREHGAAFQRRCPSRCRG